jgi:hypothetical protein
MPFNFACQKKKYFPPTVTELTLEQAKHFVACNANCSDQEAADLLESMKTAYSTKSGVPSCAESN